MKENEFATRVSPFTRSLKSMQDSVNAMAPCGGGDGPECVCIALLFSFPKFDP